MRIRYIKPSICVNEDLPAIGLDAYVLFTGLWMLADRAGRFEALPRKLKALLVPFWDEIDAERIEEILWKLCEKQMIRLYSVGDKRYGCIINWEKHQYFHARERTSKIPAPDGGNANGSGVLTKTEAALSQDSVKTEAALSQDSVLFNQELLSGICISGIPKTSGGSSHFVEAVKTAAAGMSLERSERVAARPENQDENPPPPPPQNPTQTTPPQNANGVARKTPSASTTDAEFVRESLNILAPLVHMPPADDQILARILEACRGAPGVQIHEALRGLYLSHRLDAMRSWGLLPVLLNPIFQKECS